MSPTYPPNAERSLPATRMPRERLAGNQCWLHHGKVTQRSTKEQVVCLTSPTLFGPVLGVELAGSSEVAGKPEAFRDLLGLFFWQTSLEEIRVESAWALRKQIFITFQFCVSASSGCLNDSLLHKNHPVTMQKIVAVVKDNHWKHSCSQGNSLAHWLNYCNGRLTFNPYLKVPMLTLMGTTSNLAAHVSLTSS